ncbi:hypothetical protein [Paracoccus sp. R86501]|uniref:hypothetical protein n=1 Tax=Paracoccus sp. R86501 TaxID=3101711 RepID=UPI00366AFF8D
MFERKARVFVPAPKAQSICAMLEQAHRQMDNLAAAVASLQKGYELTRSLTSAPLIARVIRGPDQRFPDLDILKIKKTLDYLLLEQSEMVIMSSPIDNPAVHNIPYAKLASSPSCPRGTNWPKNPRSRSVT